MPGQNFTQISPRILQPRLAELGKIKIGGKGAKRRNNAGKEWQLPVKYDHFVVTGRAVDPQTGNYVRDEAVHRVIGERPMELDIRLLWNEPGQNWQYFLAAYDGKRKRCSGNGETAQDVEHGTVPCTCPWFKGHKGGYDGPQRAVGNKAPTCKPHGRLSVILETAQSFGGYHVFRTTSWETISSITAALDTFQRQFGFLSGLPLRMVVYSSTDTYEEGGQIKQSTSYKVSLVLRASFDAAFQLAAAAHERRAALQLPAGPDLAQLHQRQLLEAEEAEAEQIAAEFHPETQAGAPAEAKAHEDALSDEEEELEHVLRFALDALEWEPVRINKQIAKYASNLQELERILEKEAPKELAYAREQIAKRRQPEGEPAPAEDGSDWEIIDDGEEPAEAPHGTQEELF